MKKKAALFLGLLIMLSMLPFGAFAAGGGGSSSSPPAPSLSSSAPSVDSTPVTVNVETGGGSPAP